MNEPPNIPLLTELRELLAARFDDQELRTLCFDLGVSYDDLRGEGRAGKARELVSHLDRRGSIPQLIEVGRRQRPDIPWPELAPDQPAIAAAWEAARAQYDAQIIKQYGEIRIFGQTTPKPLKEIFTDVFVLDQPTALRRFDPEAIRDHLRKMDRGEPWRAGERLPAEKLLSRGSKFFILGRPGAGKTTFLKRLAVREAQRGAWGPCLGKIPIFVSLKQFAETKKSLFDYIVDQFTVCHFPEAAPFVEPLLKSRQALVLFDGLDEVTKSAEAKDDRRGQVTQDIELFAKQYDGCHIVVTCRIAATEYTFPPPFTYLEMADFAPEQVDAFVRSWFWDPAAPDASAALAERMLAELARPDHAGIRDLARSPLLLTLLCLSYAETLSFPARRAEIYDEALQALLKKWDVSRQIQRVSVYKSLSVGRKQQMFARIAYDGFVQDEILFTQANLEDQLKAYLVHVPGLPDLIDMDAERVLHEIIEQHGLFAEQSRGLFSFAHLTFQEYYAAKYIADSAAPATVDALLARMSDDKWREVFLLTADLLPDATPFLAAFEGALYRLVASRPQLAAWLRWIDERATASQAGDRRLATRVFYALAVAAARAGARAAALDRAHTADLARAAALDRAHTAALARSRTAARTAARAAARAAALDRARAAALDHADTLDRARAAAFDRVLDLDRARAAALDHTLDLGRTFVLDRALLLAGDLALPRNLALEIAQVREALLDLCQRQGRTALHAAISALVMPDEKAPDAARANYASELAQVIESQGDLARYRELEAEAAALEPVQKKHWPLSDEDLDAFLAYTNASNLFHDCLQLAYTPDRQAFEDRIFWVPEQGV